MNHRFPHFASAASGDHFPHPALGVDYGQSRIGIAATDDFGIMAHPIETISLTTLNAIARIAELSRLRNIKTLVVGLPLRLDGSEGSSAKKVRAFAEKLADAIPTIPMIFVDETYTTSVATEKLREAGRKNHRQKDIIDQAAAVEILNGWMGETS
ncbi:MAG: Holliday junction resolvase RuvX [Armatimonadetes bacterium]|nr:Holliday junction resolvase RuvX [Akkermansiaceae bacterium]